MSNIFDKYTKDQTIENKDLQDLQFLLNRLKDCEHKLKVHEENGKFLQNDLEHIKRKAIPELFNKIGLQKINLTTGQQIEVKNVLYTSIAKEKVKQLYKELISLYGIECEDLFKTELVINDAPAFAKQLFIDSKIPYDEEKTIHWKTLNAFCKKLLEQGKKIPDSVTVFQYKEAEIKE